MSLQEPKPDRSGVHPIPSISRTPSPSSLPPTLSVISSNSTKATFDVGLVYNTFQCDSSRRSVIEPNHQMFFHAPKTPSGKYGVLMLDNGDAGTFTFNKQILDSHDKLMLQSPPGDRHPNVRHLPEIKEGLSFVGTKGCSTCVAVYLEIFGQRCFCAHMNAWPGPRSSTSEPCDPTSRAWKVIRETISADLRKHAQEHGWTPDDVKLTTVIVACPHPQYAGSAVFSGIKDFLGLSESVLLDPHPSHGFIVAPGALAERNSKMLTLKWIENRQIPNDVPQQFEETVWSTSKPDSGFSLRWP